MKLPDVNVLLNAVNEASDDHQRAKEWLTESLSGTETVAFSWLSLTGFIRIATRPRLIERPLDVATAIQLARGWLEVDCAEVAEPGPRHLEIIEDLISRVGRAGGLVSDAHLAAIAIERGATVASFDADFHHFAGLRFEFLGAR